MLLYGGVTDREVMIDILDFTLDVDGRSFSTSINFEPGHEIEPVTP